MAVMEGDALPVDVEFELTVLERERAQRVGTAGLMRCDRLRLAIAQALADKVGAVDEERLARERLATLLATAVNVLYGDPGPRVLWSFSELPADLATIKAACDLTWQALKSPVSERDMYRARQALGPARAIFNKAATDDRA